MKTKRNLSGITFIYKGENVCFEDLPESEQDKIFNYLHPVSLKNLCKQLANTINQLGDSYSLMK